jgi:hypothetical protein
MFTRNAVQRSDYSLLPLVYAAAIASFLSLVPHSAVGAEGATIRLPDEFAAQALRVQFTGFGGYNRGVYVGGEFTGEFTRIESRLGVFDPLFVANRGKSSFTVENSPDLGGLSANCRAVQNVATVRVVTLDLKKLAYQCEFTGIALSDEWRFVLGEPKRNGFREKLLARERRQGEAFVLDQEILIDSVHNYDRSPLTSQSPLGYLLESNGVVIAAVDLLDWNPIVHLREGLADSARQAAVVVALSLAVLRDPVNSALED